MASRIEEFDEEILYHAKREFLEKGYSDASLRNIASAAHVSTSTIYTRYVDKEGLFSFIVRPAYDAMLGYIERSLSSFEDLPSEEQLSHKDDLSDTGFTGLIDILYSHFDEFKLIVQKSPVNFYRDFLERIVELDMQCTRCFLVSTGSKAYTDGRINDGFLHVVSSAFYSGVFEAVIHDMPRAEAETYINELRNFYNNGWRDYF